MPFKSIEERREYNRRYSAARYEQDPTFKEKKRKKTAEWRKKVGNYYEYMKEYMTKKKQHDLWLVYRTEWKARKNRKVYLETLQALKNSEHFKKSHMELEGSE